MNWLQLKCLEIESEAYKNDRQKEVRFYLIVVFFLLLLSGGIGFCRFGAGYFFYLAWWCPGVF